MPRRTTPLAAPAATMGAATAARAEIGEVGAMGEAMEVVGTAVWRVAGATAVDLGVASMEARAAAEEMEEWKAAAAAAVAVAAARAAKMVAVAKREDGSGREPAEVGKAPGTTEEATAMAAARAMATAE